MTELYFKGLKVGHIEEKNGKYIFWAIGADGNKTDVTYEDDTLKNTIAAVKTDYETMGYAFDDETSMACYDASKGFEVIY